MKLKNKTQNRLSCQMQEVRMRVRELGKGGQKIQLSGYKINKLWDLQHGYYNSQDCIVYLKFAKFIFKILITRKNATYVR